MKNTASKLQLIFGDVNLGVKGEQFHYLFSYQKNGLESLKVKGHEWLYREPRTAFWRATTDNDRGNQFSQKSAVWLGADLFPKCIGKEIIVDGQLIDFPSAPNNNQYGEEFAETVSIRYFFETNTVPSTTVTISYQVDSEGKIRVESNYQGVEGLPQLPAFGVRLIMPTVAQKFVYQGLSGETYPDRMAGGVPGEYEVDGLPVTPYLVPQECGMHMETEWVEVTRTHTLNHNNQPKEPITLRVNQVDQSFAFSCLPYTPFELENATHQEELPLARRTVLTIYGAVRGIGGIDSWGSDVRQTAQISSEENQRVAFEIAPVFK
jgi:Beta galactosidase small chain.